MTQEQRRRAIEYLASTRFDADEWKWYNNFQDCLNAKAQARWDGAHDYAADVLSTLERIVGW